MKARDLSLLSAFILNFLVVLPGQIEASLFTVEDVEEFEKPFSLPAPLLAKDTNTEPAQEFGSELIFQQPVPDSDSEDDRVLHSIEKHLLEVQNNNCKDFFSFSILNGKINLSIKGKTFIFPPRDGVFEIVTKGCENLLRFKDLKVCFPSKIPETNYEEEQLSVSIIGGKIVLFFRQGSYDFPIDDHIMSLKISDEVNSLLVGPYFWTEWKGGALIPLNFEQMSQHIVYSLSKIGLSQVSKL